MDVKFSRVYIRHKEIHLTLISFVFLSELQMSFLPSSTRPHSIVLPCSRLREVILVSDQL